MLLALMWLCLIKMPLLFLNILQNLCIDSYTLIFCSYSLFLLIT